MLTRDIGVTLIVFAVVVVAMTCVNLYFFTKFKGSSVSGRYEVNAYLTINSIILILSSLILALGVLLVIPESHWQRKIPEPPLDL
jgi:hypothetical protein